eukprot:symbB.v1.2.017679.t1/scaffold1368.1/size123082/6
MGPLYEQLLSPVRLQYRFLVRPLELALESSSADTSKTLFVEPLLPLRDLERFLLQTTEVEEETYLSWCRSVVGQRIAERDVSSRGSKETWRIARVKSFDMVAKLPVHTLVYDDGEDAKLLLHLREVVALAEAGDACFDGPEEATQAPDSTQDEPEGTAPDTEGSEEGDEGHDVSEEDGEAAEKIHKLVVKMPMVQEGEIPFEMVWADYLEAGEAVLQASLSPGDFSRFCRIFEFRTEVQTGHGLPLVGRIARNCKKRSRRAWRPMVKAPWHGA